MARRYVKNDSAVYMPKVLKFDHELTAVDGDDDLWQAFENMTISGVDPIKEDEAGPHDTS